VTSAELVWRLSDVGFSVSKRTIERDLNELSLIFALERNDKSIPFGWYWSINLGTEPRSHVDLQDYLRSSMPQPLEKDGMQLQAWVSDELARQLRQTPLAADMQLTALGEGHRLQATVSDGLSLRGWLLSQGNGLVVERPLALREEIARILRSAAARYPQTQASDRL
jgi:predicted DNA-binding transcriptional regulator YafY